MFMRLLAFGLTSNVKFLRNPSPLTHSTTNPSLITRPATCGSTSLKFGSVFFSSMSRHVIKILQLSHPDRLCESEACSFSCAISDLGSKCSYLDITYLLISIKMLLTSILIINTLTMLTIGHADRGSPTLKR